MFVEAIKINSKTVCKRRCKYALQFKQQIYIRTEALFNMLTHPRISQVLRHTCYNLPAQKSDLSCRHTAILQENTAMLCLFPCPPPHLSLFQCQNKTVSFICASNIILLSRLWEVSRFFLFLFHFYYGEEHGKIGYPITFACLLRLRIPTWFSHFIFFSSSSTCFHRMWKENISESIATLGI